jgi:hypothetical protein
VSDLETFQRRLLTLLGNNLGDIASVIFELREQTKIDGLIHPDNQNAASETWGKIGGFLWQNRLYHLAADVTLAWYDRINELQKPNKRYHKGAPAYYSAMHLLQAGDRRGAFWFCTMAFIEDVLSGNNDQIPTSAATKTLRIQFRQNQQTLGAIASRAIELKTKQPNIWMYPEATAVYLAREGKLLQPVTALSGDVQVNRPFLNQLIANLQADKSTKKKGNSLEFLASYLSITLPGVAIQPNVKSFEQGGTFEHEIDLVVTQYGTLSTYLLEAMGRHFLIECKNWNRRVGVAELNHFVAKIRFHRCKCGVIFSKSGLTGERALKRRGPQFARLTQLRWYHQDECTLIVVNERDLNQVADGSLTFAQLLLRGYESVKFSTFDTKEKTLPVAEPGEAMKNDINEESTDYQSLGESFPVED